MARPSSERLSLRFSTLNRDFKAKDDLFLHKISDFNHAKVQKRRASGVNFKSFEGKGSRSAIKNVSLIYFSIEF